MRTLLALLVMTGSLLAPTVRAETPDTTKVPVKGAMFDPYRDAAKDLQEATVLARTSGKNVLVEVGGNWCSWCRRLNMLFDENKEIKEILASNFVMVHLNWSKENKNEAVLAHYPKIAGYPHFFVLDGEGKLLKSQDSGALEEGDHHDPEKVKAFLSQWKAKR